MRGRNFVVTSAVLLSLIATMGVTTPAYAQSAPSEQGAVAPPSEAEAPAEEVAAEPWTPPAEAADGEAPASNPPADSWQPVQETRLTPAPGSNARSAPAGTAAGKPGIGELPWFGFQDFELWENSSVRVNLANGNLVVKADDSEIAVPGFGLRQDRYYNGLSTVIGTMGGGWQSNNGANDVGVQDGGSYVDYFAVNGAKFRFTASGSNYTAPSGSNLSLKKDAASMNERFVVESNKSGEKWKFSSSGWLTSTVDRNNIGETYTYDASNRIASVTNTNGRGYAYSYTAAGKLQIVTDTAGRTTRYYYDAAGRLEQARDSDGNNTNYTYDSVGRLASVNYPAQAASATTSFAYDASHRVTTVTQQVGSSSNTVSTTFTYNSGETVVADPNGNAAKYKIDGEGRVSETTDALNRKRSQTWTANSDVQTTTDAMASGNVRTYTYDGNSNQTRAQLPTGAAASAAYAVGANCSAPNTGTAFQPKCSTDAAGNSKQYQYDGSGNLTKQTNTTNGANQTEFESTYENNSRSICGGFAGQVCSTKDGNGKTTTYTYNVNGDMTKITPPAPMGATTYSFDSLGRVTSTTDGNNQTTTYVYDVLDRIIEETAAGTGTIYSVYYDDGLLRRKSPGAGTFQRMSYEYDRLGRLTSQELYGSTAQTYTYDSTGNLLTFTNGSGATTYTYDAANQLKSIREPGGTCPTSGNPAANSGCVLLEYDNNAKETRRIYPGGAIVETSRDNSGRATRTTAKAAGGATAVDVGYSYAFPGTNIDQGNLQVRTAHKEEGITAGAATTYTYDRENRVTKAEEKSGPTVTASWAYTYDGAGNRTQQVRSGSTGAAAGTINFTYNDANQITSATGQSTTWTYDGAGQQTRNGLTGQNIAYNSRLQATNISGTNQAYLYTGNTDRILSGNTGFENGALGLTRATTGTTSKNFTRSPSGTAVGYRTTTGNYFINDNLGSVLGIFTSAGAYAGGYSYSPYGEARSTGTNAVVTANPLRYIGGELDATGLYKLGARYYDPSLGRFTQTDPSGQELNPYAYAAANPINASDPSGLAINWNDVGFHTTAGILSTGYSLLLGVAAAPLCIGIVTCIGVELFAAVGGGMLGDGTASLLWGRQYHPGDMWGLRW